jgi:hypothetical protein
MAGNTTYATLATTTLINFANEIFDNVITNNALLNALQKKGNIKVVSGGRQFTHPVYYSKNSTFASMAKYGTIATGLQDPLTRSEWDIKVLAGSVVYSMVDEAMNAGNKEKLIDLVEALKMDAETSMTELMGDQLFTAEASLGSNDLDSIPRIIADSPSTQTVNVGGIDSSASTQTYWRNQIYTTAIATFSASAAGLTAMDQTLNNCTFGRQGPTIIITTKSIFTIYQVTLQAQVRYAKLEAGDGAFKNLLYATLPVYFDDNCTASHMFFIDTNSLKLQVLKQGNMKMTAFQQAYSQLMARALLYILCNLTCGSRRTQGTITAITG